MNAPTDDKTLLELIREALQARINQEAERILAEAVEDLKKSIPEVAAKVGIEVSGFVDFQTRDKKIVISIQPPTS